MPRRKRTSDVGRAVARLNAVAHGLTADAPVIPGVESPGEWEAFRQGWADDLKPEGMREEFLAARVASLAWRLRRVIAAEREAVTAFRSRIGLDLALQGRWRGMPASVEEAEERREEAARCVEIVRGLTSMPTDTPLATADVLRILDELADEADEDREALLDGAPGARAPEAGGAWTRGALLGVLKAIARRDGATFAGALVSLGERMLGMASGAELAAVEAREEMERMLRERMLPEAPRLEQQIRYETMLHRQLNQSLADFDAAQAARAGRPQPMIRIQHAAGG
jgi:hypothetical protein